MPHRTATGAVYDSGVYGRNMDLALGAARWSAFPERRAESARRNRLRGIGLANYIEGAGGVPGEYAAVFISDNGRVAVGAGCVAQGQGHETALRQIAAGELGIAVEHVDVNASDTDLIRDGVGTNASRSMVRAGTALVGAIRAAVEKGKMAAARLLQAAPEDVDFADGCYRVAGTGRSVGLFEVARANADAPAAGGWSAEYRNDGDAVTYPNGCHVCEVEIDPETGTVTVLAMVAVDDVGRAINPAIVHGQSQGGMAQGIGQALMEQGVYDRDSGQFLTGSFLDYAVPRAAHLPSMRPILNDVPSPTNPLGVKGAGEGGATGAPAAVMNAVLDALSPLGIAEIDMPATPHGVWRVLRDAGRIRR
jgi:carbon-monoxide dehydrogenase large subunit